MAKRLLLLDFTTIVSRLFNYCLTVVYIFKSKKRR